MLKVFDPLEYEMQKFFREEKPATIVCYASELMEHFQLSEDEMNDSVERAFNACGSLHISIRENFLPVYRSTEGRLITDWQLSPLACYLLIINSNPANAEIAQLQIIFATKKFNDVHVF